MRLKKPEIPKMADSTVVDISKMKVRDLRKELKSRGLSYANNKAELVSRLQAAIAQESQDEHADIHLDSDEIDSVGVLEYEDDKSEPDVLDDSVVEIMSEHIALADQPPVVKAPSPAKTRTFKRKITADTAKEIDSQPGENKEISKKIVLNRTISLKSTTPKPDEDKTEASTESKKTESIKVKITADIDPKTRLELRAKRFGLPVKLTDAERMEARKQRFGQNSGKVSISTSTPALTENMEKLKQRAKRFGQSVSAIMTDIEMKERLERRKAKFSTVN